MENQAHIYIYGIIDSFQDKNSSDWGYVNLTNVRDQVEKQKEKEEIVVHIHSEGGVVTEGFAIHDYLRSQNKPITTIIDGTCASIATVILLAGDKRIGTENSKPFIHNPWGMAGGDKEEMRKYADDLEQIEEEIATFYAAKTKLSKDEALELMKNETSFTTEQCLSNGFLTEINSVMRAVALLKPNNNNKKMSTEKMTEEKVQSLIDKGIEKISNLFKTSEVQNKTVTDATGVEILFPDVEEDAAIEVEQTATIDGAAAEGEVLMPNGETYVFESGVLKEIKEAEEAPEEDVEALKQKITDLETENESLKGEKNLLTTEVNDLKETAKGVEKEVGEIKETLNLIKKNSGSSFKFNRKEKVEKKQNATRQVFKTKDEE